MKSLWCRILGSVDYTGLIVTECLGLLDSKVIKIIMERRIESIRGGTQGNL